MSSFYDELFIWGVWFEFVIMPFPVFGSGAGIEKMMTNATRNLQNHIRSVCGLDQVFYEEISEKSKYNESTVCPIIWKIKNHS